MMSRALLWSICLGLLALVAARPAQAAGAITGQPLSVCIARAQPGMDAAKLLAAPAGFDCRTPQTRFGRGDYWAVSGPLPARTATGIRLGVRIASLWQRSVTLYALYPDGRIVVRPMADAEASRRIQLGAVLMQRLPARDQAPIRLAWYVRDAANVRGILVAPAIATPAEAATANLVMAALYSAFGGLAAALLVHNLAIWRVLRQRFQLWYVAMLAGILTYALSSSGALAWAWPDVTNTMRMRVNYLALGGTAVTALGFARSFFEPRVFAGWLGRYATAVAAAILVTSVTFALAAPWHINLLDRLYSGTFVLLIGIAVPMVWRAWRLKSDYRWLFALIWAAPVVLSAIRVAHNFGIVGWHFWLDNSTLIGMATEALGASLAIAYRVRQLARDRDAARAEELAARLLADADPLTGLLNRRAFLAQAIGRAGEQALLILDLDRFKAVNDTIGHDGGDEVLRRVARVLRAACPAGGLATRFGGEEFALLCPVGDLPDPLALLAELRETRMPYDLTVTASIGGGAGPLLDEKDWKALYRAVDRALFAAKHAGRDRYRPAGEVRALAA